MELLNSYRLTDTSLRLISGNFISSVFYPFLSCFISFLFLYFFGFFLSFSRHSQRWKPRRTRPILLPFTHFFFLLVFAFLLFSLFFLPFFKEMNHLEELQIPHSIAITPLGLEILLKLKNLKYLYLPKSASLQDGVFLLKENNFDLKISECKYF